MGLFDFLWMSEKDQKRLKEMDDDIRRMENGLYEMQWKKEEAKRKNEEAQRRWREEHSRWDEEKRRNKEYLNSNVQAIKSNVDKNRGFFVDERDERKYETIKIGEQIWFAENLKCNHEKSFSLPSGDEKYYQYDILNDICPKGWHIPSVNEYEKLFYNVGGAKFAARLLKSTYSWDKSSEINTDAYGFNALAAGYIKNGSVYEVGFTANFWTRTTENDKAYCMSLQLESPTAYLSNELKTMAFSVRCIKD